MIKNNKKERTTTKKKQLQTKRRGNSNQKFTKNLYTFVSSGNI